MKERKAKEYIPNNPSSDHSAGNDFPVVGIGASAGGVQALLDFFREVPPDCGICFVVLLHLSPEHGSQLKDVLQAVSDLPVELVKNRIRITRNHIYVMPPDQRLKMDQEYLVASTNQTEEDRRAPVDIFFRTLGAAMGERSVCVILSGTGANGSMGLKHIKECGGVAFVQNPREAEFNEMPRNAIATGLVDDVLPVAEIPRKIISYKENSVRIGVLPEPPKNTLEEKQALRDVFNLLRMRTGHDFSNYKHATLLRRIERRINVHSLSGLPAYAAFLQRHQEESAALLKDLLISVTNFFRDKNAFEALDQSVISHLVEKKKGENVIRVWVTGCATGEEAYSIAILFAEKTLDVLEAPKVQIFATDIDENALAYAREGLYSINEAADIHPEKLHRYFNKEGSEYRVRKEIREMILFANHNVIKDPPFSHLDLVTCRNVLIYLNHSAQERIMKTFHFALEPEGFLFLGSAESASGSADLYNVFNREFQIYRSRQLNVLSYPVPESVPQFQIRAPKTVLVEQYADDLDQMNKTDLHQRLLEQYAPPSVVINEEYEVIHLSNKVGAYLQVGGGEPSRNLLKLIRPDLRLELRSAVYQSIQRRTIIEARGVKTLAGERQETINIIVKPAFHSEKEERGFLLVIFEPAPDEEARKEVALSNDQPVARQLEEELARLKARLRASVEQHEFNAEELKASNEELQAMNEELRSAAEELETSKEELQSINEELRTVNQELKVKIEETTLANNNLQNLIDSADIGTIFLNRSFRVALFTPTAKNYFNLIANDIGRPLSDITHKLNYQDVMADAEQVMKNLLPVEREVSTSDDRLVLMRMLPYRTSEDQINGVVITFIDFTERAEVEKALRQSEEKLAAELAGMTSLYQLNEKLLHAGSLETTLQEILTAALGFTHTDRGNIQLLSNHGRDLVISVHQGHGEAFMEYFRTRSCEAVYQAALHARRRLVFEDVEQVKELQGTEDLRMILEDGIHAIQCTPVISRRGVVLGMLNTHFPGPRGLSENEVRKLDMLAWLAADFIERSVADETIKRSESHLSAIFANAEVGLSEISLEGNFISVNDTLCKILGRSREDLLRLNISDVTYPEDLPQSYSVIEALLKTGQPVSIDKRYHRPDNGIVWANSTLSLITPEPAQQPILLAVTVDLTERKALEKQKEDFLAIASHELKTPVTSIKVYVELLHETLLEENASEKVILTDKLNMQVDRLTELIHALLDTTKITEGKLSLEPEWIDMNEILRKRIADLWGYSVKQKILLKEGIIPAVKADAKRVGQVLDNLVSNAAKYSPAGEEILITTGVSEKDVIIRIKDSGIGMTKDLQEKIFERFYRSGDTRVNTFPGLGLGLYIASEIIRQHGGTIGVESEPENGSTFFFTLPYSSTI